jgi:hypothetical protein
VCDLCASACAALGAVRAALNAGPGAVGPAVLHALHTVAARTARVVLRSFDIDDDSVAVLAACVE